MNFVSTMRTEVYAHVHSPVRHKSTKQRKSQIDRHYRKLASLDKLTVVRNTIDTNYYCQNTSSMQNKLCPTKAVKKAVAK